MDAKHTQKQEEQLQHFLSHKYTLSRDFYVLAESGVRFGERVLKGILHHIILNERDFYSYLNAQHEKLLGFSFEDKVVNANTGGLLNTGGTQVGIVSPYREDLLECGWTVFDSRLIRK